MCTCRHVMRANKKGLKSLWKSLMAQRTAGETVSVRNQIRKQVSREKFSKLISIPSTPKGKQRPLNRADLRVLVMNT